MKILLAVLAAVRAVLPACQARWCAPTTTGSSAWTSAGNVQAHLDLGSTVYLTVGLGFNS